MIDDTNKMEIDSPKDLVQSSCSAERISIKHEELKKPSEQIDSKDQ